MKEEILVAIVEVYDDVDSAKITARCRIYPKEEKKHLHLKALGLLEEAVRTGVEQWKARKAEKARNKYPSYYS